MRWLDFLGGAAWALVLDRPPVSSSVECQCKCECEAYPCPVTSWWWEVCKVLIYVALGVFIQSLKLVQRIGQWKWPHPVSDPSPVIEPVQELDGPREEDPIRVQILAQQQIQALRRRQAGRT